MTQALIGFETRLPLQHWNALLEEWLLLVDRYGRLAPRYPVWHLGERANAALLASAACRCGWVGVCERFVNSTDSVDLLLYLPDASVELIEVKEAADRSKGGTALMAATQQVLNRTPPFEINRRIGVAFNVIDREGLYQEEEIVSAIDNLRTFAPDAMAWYFPAQFRAFRYKRGGRSWISPGLLLIAKAAAAQIV